MSIVLTLTLIAVIIVTIVLLWPRYKESPQNVMSVPNWRGLVPGKTTRQEVIQIMGQPNNIKGCIIQSDTWATDLARCFNGHLIYEYQEQPEQGGPQDTHEIHFLSETVWFIVEDVPRDSQMTIDRFISRYGLPEKVTWSRMPSYLNAVLFCQQGVIAHANINRVEKVFYFEPMSLDKCLKEFSNEVTTKNPYIGTDIILVEDPWGFNQRR